MEPKAQARFEFKRLAGKNAHIKVPVLTGDSWKEVLRTSPNVPQSLEAVRKLTHTVFCKTPENANQASWRTDSECGEPAANLLFTALGNPGLDDADRAEIEGEIDETLPLMQLEHSTDEHFVLKWTNNSNHAADNITDRTIVEQTGEFLESAWTKIESLFSETPYVPLGSDRIEVVFHDIGIYNGFADPPDGPIHLNSLKWNQQPGIRRAVAAHELFHKLQYKFGYRNPWPSSETTSWFSEGMASLAELFVGSQVSSAQKLLDLFEKPHKTLLSASYAAMPFWHFFESTLKADGVEGLKLFLQEYKLTGNIAESLEHVAQLAPSLPGPLSVLEGFFALFSADRLLETKWTDLQISDPSGTIIQPNLKFKDLALPFDGNRTIQYLGSVYFRFMPDVAQRPIDLRLRINASVGDVIIEVFQQRDDGNFVPQHRWEQCPVNESLTLGIGVAGSVVVLTGKQASNKCRIEASIV